MDVQLIFKIAAVGIIVTILNQVLVRSGREEQATMTTLAGLVVVLMIVAQKIAQLFDLVQSLRYGENPHQSAKFYREQTKVPYSLAFARQLNGRSCRTTISRMPMPRCASSASSMSRSAWDSNI